MAALLFLAGAVSSRSQAQSADRAVVAIENWTPNLDTHMESKSLKLGSPIFLRIVKSLDGSERDGYLEAFVEDDDGKFQFLKSWDICTWSGQLGPKFKEGDGQSPEGFYYVTPGRMNPNSSYHLSFNLGFPNGFDRAHGRTGSYLMVHGDCVSIGCYAMTDDGIEEIYALMSAAFDGGQPFIRVHVFPFPMTRDNLRRFETNPNIDFWHNLKAGWDWFEDHKRPPNVTTAEKLYRFSDN
jgi:murein L,D-transpeptidase YafK